MLDETKIKIPVEVLCMAKSKSPIQKIIQSKHLLNYQRGTNETPIEEAPGKELFKMLVESLIEALVKTRFTIRVETAVRIPTSLT